MAHPTHSTRISDSSLYDEVCNNCGANDGALGGDALERPCRKPQAWCDPADTLVAPAPYISQEIRKDAAWQPTYAVTPQQAQAIVEAAAPAPGRHATVLIPGPIGTFLLLDHIKAGQWRFPGGRLEEDELPIAAAARELYEEVGIEATHLHLLDTIQHHVSGRDWIGSYYLCANYAGVPRVVEPSKHRGFRYLSLEEIRTLGHESDYRIALRQLYPRT